MAGQMYFGTRNNMKWIPAPLTGPDLTPGSYTAETTFQRGSFGLYQSLAGARQYPYEFGLKTPAQANHLLNTASGAYGDTVYFLDPFAMNTNILPVHWSQPWMAAYGAPNLQGKDRYQQAVEPTTNNTFGYPRLSAIMGDNPDNGPFWDSYGPGQDPMQLWIPVPQGYTFHFGAHSNDPSNTGMMVSFYTGPLYGLSGVATPLPNNTAQLTNYTFTPSVNTGITVALTYQGPSNNASFSGLIAQVLPNGQPAPTGDFISGQGNSGCRFVGPVRSVGVSTAYGLQYSATLKEYGDWVDD